ncbi:MAG: DUF4870 domain-containing protein [Arenicellales bacterium]
MRHCGIVLLVAGIGLLVASGVPLAQALWPSPSPGPALRLTLPPGGGRKVLEIPRGRHAVPVLRLEAEPAIVANQGPALRYAFAISDAAGRSLIRKTGRTRPRGTPPVAEVRFPEINLPAGRTTVRLELDSGGEPVRRAELRLPAPSPGLLAPLLTALMLAILGWLTATLGALQWIRAEAAMPVLLGAGSALESERETRLWRMACHLSALLGYLVPFGHIVGPLTVWLAKRRTSPGLDEAGRGVLNFQLSVTLYVLVALMLSFFLVGLAFLFVIIVFHFSAVLFAALRAQRGLPVSYPLTIRII